MPSCYNVALGCVMKIEGVSCSNFECRFPDSFLHFKCSRGAIGILMTFIQVIFSSASRLEKGPCCL